MSLTEKELDEVSDGTYSSSLEDYQGYSKEEAEADRKEELRQEWVDEQISSALDDYISDNPDLYKEFIEEKDLQHEFKKYCKDIMIEDSHNERYPTNR